MAIYEARQVQYAAKLISLLDTYKNILIVGVDNVGSSQMQKVRLTLRGRAVVLMGKNTIIRKIIREKAEKEPKFESLLPLIVYNVGFVFTNEPLAEIRKLILEKKVPAGAKVGAIAPVDVFIPAGPSGLDPGQTAFFQALNIGTKIVKGTIEIVNQVHLIKVGDRVSASHVALLGKLNVLPFFYGFQVDHVYEDGAVYESKILDISQADLIAKFHNGVAKLASLSLAISYPTLVALPHLFANALKPLIAISLETSIEIEQAKKIKEYLKDPSKFAAAAPAAAAAGAKSPAKAAKPAAKEKSEEEEADMGFSLFD